MRTKEEEMLSAYMEYVELSKTLFASDVFMITDLPTGSKFLAAAHAVAKELEIGWDGMSQTDSNRIMLALLDDYYNNMAAVAGSKNLTLTITITKNEQAKKK